MKGRFALHVVNMVNGNFLTECNDGDMASCARRTPRTGRHPARHARKKRACDGAALEENKI